MSISGDWTYLYEGFLQFRVLIRYLELISVPNSKERLIMFNIIRHFVLVEGDC